MSIVDAVGNIHDTKGQFSGHVRSEGDTSQVLAGQAVTHQVCNRCGLELHRDRSSWVDETGGDVCGDDPNGRQDIHLLSVVEERPAETLRAGDTIWTNTGTLRVTRIDEIGGRISGYDQWGEPDATDLPSPGTNVLFLVPPASVDDTLTGSEADLFTQAGIEQLGESWHLAIAAGATHVRNLVGQQIGLTRAKRLADAATAMWPDARYLVIDADPEGGPDLHVACLQFHNGDILQAEPDDARWQMLDAETLGLCGDDTGWQNTCSQAGPPSWRMVIGEARQIDSIDLANGMYQTSRHRPPRF